MAPRQRSIAQQFGTLEGQLPASESTPEQALFHYRNLVNHLRLMPIRWFAVAIARLASALPESGSFQYVHRVEQPAGEVDRIELVRILQHGDANTGRHGTLQADKNATFRLYLRLGLLAPAELAPYT